MVGVFKDYKVRYLPLFCDVFLHHSSLPSWGDHQLYVVSAVFFSKISSISKNEGTNSSVSTSNP